MSDRFFTIALPVRNGGQYLKECVASIFAQRYGNFEVAILDNASTDGTSEWLATLRDPRVRLYPADRLLSIEENWARIKTIPKQEFLTTIGHDDLLDPSFLEVISRLINEHPEAELYATHFRLIDKDGAFLRHCLPVAGRETAAEFLAARLCNMRDSFGTGHVFRSARYDKVGGIPAYPKLLYADDALFMRLIGSSYRATSLEAAFSYRQHTASTSGAGIVRSLLIALERYKELLTELQENDPAVRTVLRRYFADYALRIGECWLEEERTEAYRARRPVDAELRSRALALTLTFGESTQSFRAGDFQTWLLEKAALSPWYRTLLRAWSVQRRLGASVYRHLTDWVARPIAANNLLQ